MALLLLPPLLLLLQQPDWEVGLVGSLSEWPQQQGATPGCCASVDNI
jgi:hypothetical protein